MTTKTKSKAKQPPRPATPTLDRMQAPDEGGWTRRDGEPCRLVDHSNLLGEFLDWLQADGIHLARWGLHDEIPVYWTQELAKAEGKRWRFFGDTPDLEEGEVGEFIVHHFKPVIRKDQMEPVHETRERLLARFYDIDLTRVDDEKRAILEWLRSLPDGPA